MAHSNSVLLDAIAEQLQSELFAYARMLEALRAAGWPVPLAVPLGDQADRVQRCANQLPRLRLALAEFLITRTDLTRRLVGPDEGRAEALGGLHAAHVADVEALERACARVRELLRPVGDNAAWPTGEGTQP